jgi:hypothetical protein
MTLVIDDDPGWRYASRDATREAPQEVCYGPTFPSDLDYLE